jgi:hypothetical protein
MTVKQTVSLPDAVAASLKLRDEQLSTAIGRCIMRYIALLAEARRDLRQQFDGQECALIIDACNGVAFFDAFSVRLLPEGVRDAIEMDGLDRKWEVDGPALLAKLDVTTFAQRMALVDAIGRWWNLPADARRYGDLLADPEPDRQVGQVF